MVTCFKNLPFLRKIPYLLIIWFLQVLLIWSCKTNDYKPFDTKSSLSYDGVKLRVLNMHFKQQNAVKIFIGGKILKEEGINLREITAYLPFAGSTFSDSIVTVTDAAGNVLLTDTLQLKYGNNYTLIISPGYDIKASRFPDGRYLYKALSQIAVLAQIPDPVVPPLSDRTSLRTVSLAQDDNIKSGDDKGYVAAYLVKSKPDFGSLYKDPVINSMDEPFGPPLPNIPSLVRFTNYKAYPTFEASIEFRSIFRQGATKVSNSIRFENGKSYTLLTVGTKGVVNDASIPVDGGSTPVPLEPIPFEVFLIDDFDLTLKSITSLPLSLPNQHYASLFLFHLNDKWNKNNPASSISLSVDGRATSSVRDGTVYYGEGNYPLPVEYGSVTDIFAAPDQTGNRTVSVTKFGQERPYLAQSTIDLSNGGTYQAFFYNNSNGSDKLKIIAADTALKTGMVRVNIAHFAHNLEDISIIETISGKVLVTSVGFEAISNGFDLPITFTLKAGKYDKVVPLMSVVKAGTSIKLFDLNLNYYSDNVRLYNDIDESAIAADVKMGYTIILRGNYAIADPNASDAFEKIFASIGRANNPKTTGDNYLVNLNYKFTIIKP